MFLNWKNRIGFIFKQLKHTFWAFETVKRDTRVGAGVKINKRNNNFNASQSYMVDKEKGSHTTPAPTIGLSQMSKPASVGGENAEWVKRDARLTHPFSGVP